MKTVARKWMALALVSGTLTTGWAHAHGMGESGPGEAFGPGMHPVHMRMHGGPGMHGDPERMIDRMAHAVNLSKEQRDAMRAVVDKNRGAMRAVRDRLQESREQMARLSASGPADPAALRPLADAHGKALADMMVLQAETRQQMDRILTDDQRAKLKALRESPDGQRPTGNPGGRPTNGGVRQDPAATLFEAHRLAREGITLIDAVPLI